MAISGPPRTSLGLFGGPGFIAALLVLFGAGVFIAYQTTGGRMPGSGASLSLPGDVAPPPPSPAPAAADEAAPQPAAELQSMPPLTASGEAAPEPDPAMPVVEIDEDLSPAELLDAYPPDPALALTVPDAVAGSAEGVGARSYRRPSTAPAGARRLALVATGLGLDRALTAQTIIATPADVSLSFAAGIDDLAGWIDAARAYGHEVLVDLQLGASGPDSVTSVIDDRILLAELGRAENLRRLDAILAAAPKAAGVTISITDAFLGDAAALTPILERLQAGGWIAVGLPVTAPLTLAADRVLQEELTAGGVSRETLALKGLVRRRGAAVVLATPENALALARSWSQPSPNASTELSLVPASALVED